MSDLTINPVALHLVSNVFSNPETKAVEEETTQLGVGAPVVANVRDRGAEDAEVIKSASQAQAAITQSRELIMSDAVAALAAQGNNLPSEVLDMLDD